MLPAGQVPGPARAIPVRFEHVPALPKPKKSAPPEEWKAYRKQQRVQNLSTHAAQTIQGLRQELDERHDAQDRRLIAVGDGSYTNQTVIKKLPPHDHVHRPHPQGCQTVLSPSARRSGPRRNEPPIRPADSDPGRTPQG